MIERIPDAGKLSREQLQAISQKSCAVLSHLGPQIQWVESYVMDDRIYCVYMAPSEELIREHARQGGFPRTEFPRSAQSSIRPQPNRRLANYSVIRQSEESLIIAFCSLAAALLSRETAEQKHAQHDKQNIRKPDEQLRVRMRISAQCIANDDEQKIRRGNDQTHGKSD